MISGRIFITLAALALPLAATAQLPSSNSAGRQLSQHLNILAGDSRNVRALIGAGEAALALDDGNAAIGFFGRAEEVDPRNPRIKLGLGRALLMLERTRDALRHFNSAQDLGLPESELAADRGLAHDLRGDQKRAQRDYALALRARPDDEVTRRLAVSLAISGDKAGAVAALAPLLRRNDRAAWRAQAFVLAITGDVAGAGAVTRSVMPAMAQPMMPFYARLARLSAAQKAQAAHFGVMPSDGRSDGIVYGAADYAPATPDGGLIPAGDAFGPRIEDLPRARPVQVASTDPRRRPGAATDRPGVAASFTPATRTVVPRNMPAQSAAAQSPPTAPPPTALTAVVRAQTTPPVAAATTAPVRIALSDLPAGARAALEKPANPVLDAVIDKTRENAPGFTNAAEPPARPVAIVTNSATTSNFSLPPSPVAKQRPSLASIVSGLELEAVEAVAPPVPVARPLAAEKKPVAKKPVEKKAAAKPDPKKAHPERHWAQLAAGSDKKALSADYGRMSRKAAAAFKGQTAWTAPSKASRRLLVGPFTTTQSARDFIKKAGVSGFAWTSPAGTEVEKLALK